MGRSRRNGKMINGPAGMYCYSILSFCLPCSKHGEFTLEMLQLLTCSRGFESHPPEPSKKRSSFRRGQMDVRSRIELAYSYDQISRCISLLLIDLSPLAL